MKERRPLDRGRRRAEELVESSSLPPEVRRQLRVVVRESQLVGDALMDVVRELITHFEDGLRAGKSGDELARSFGDEQVAAGLISREKRVANPDLRDRSVLGSKRGAPFATLVRNLSYALRRAIRSPGFTLTAVLSLAIGIGANTAIFTLVQQVLIVSPPYQDADRLVELYANSFEADFQVLSYPELMVLREATEDVFSGVAGSSVGVVQVESDGVPEVVPAEMTTGNYFETLGLSAHIGRTIQSSDEDGRTAEPVVMLSHSYWQEAYGGDVEVIGRSINLSGRPFTVVGVAPEEYKGSFGPIVPQLFAPLLLRPILEADAEDVLTSWGNHYIFGKARLRDGVTLAQAEVSAGNAAAQLLELDRWEADYTFNLVPTSEVTLYPPLDRFIWMAAVMLMVVVGLVLAIACANLASFLLARAMDRRREIAVRLALGATRRDLLAQLAAETVLLALLGGASGLALGAFGLKALVSADLPLPLPLTLDLGLNPVVFAFGLGISTLAGLLFGVVPAMEASRTDVSNTIKNESVGQGRNRGFSLRTALVASQVAVSFVLLIGAGLFLRSLLRTLAVDPGFGAEPAATAYMALPSGEYTDAEARVFIDVLLEDVRTRPEIVDVGITSNLHLNTLSTNTTGVRVDGVDPPPGRDDFSVDAANISPGYLDAIGVEVVQGRDVNLEDRADSEPVVVVNQAFADRFWPGVQDPVGRRIQFGEEESTVVGIVKTAKIRNLAEAPRPFVYRPFDQRFSQGFHIVATTRDDPSRTALDLVQVARSREPLVWGWQPRSLERHIGVVVLPRRLGALVIAAFAALALTLAAIGLYGIVSYAVAQRNREVGIRLSLGADAPAVVRLLMWTGLKPVVLGLAVGLLGALLGARLLSGLLFGIQHYDPAVFGVVSAVFVSVALSAAYAPARRVSRVNPVEALRVE